MQRKYSSLDYPNQLERDLGRINDNPDNGYSKTYLAFLYNACGKNKKIYMSHVLHMNFTYRFEK